MDADRRFDDAETAEIFERAASAEERRGSPTSPDGGMTLAELQEIGREVGIDPARIAEAAGAVTSRGTSAPPLRVLGVARSVSRTVPLPRAPSDAEWERVVAEVRATFGATGVVESHGSLRTWRNGNLQVHVEPDGERHRLRMQTVKGDALPLTAWGGAMALAGLALVAVGALGGQAGQGPLTSGAVVGILGLAGLAWQRLTLPGWAEERDRQMTLLAERIPALLAERGPDR